MNRDDYRSIRPYLPVELGTLDCWPPAVVKTLKSLSGGPSLSNVSSGKHFAGAIADLRSSLGFRPLRPNTSLGLSLFFDNLMSKDEAEKWFVEVVPRLADLVLSLPALLEDHYKNAGEIGLRLLKSQQSGMVVLSQELISALLSCALFCMFPTANRGENYLPPINFDYLFGRECNMASHENKIKCLVHYFERVSTNMPSGNVSFERKVLPFTNADFWSNSTNLLCKFEIHSSGVIEDQSTELLEVDFADRYLGGLVLQLGTLQEEIRFSINPELIIGTLFLPVMADNESIEMVDAERFSNYTGYDLTFRFSGDHKDNKCLDSMGRRRTRVIAIDALEQPGSTQYKPESLVREANKAFCGFRLNPNVEGEMGVATGNWGCGVFGGDVEVKIVIPNHSGNASIPKPDNSNSSREVSWC
ncbi:hypothetical protein CASFOL_013001 [Castilleja foliolosa]|uniref:poly(ADP-ribose) glycohydrolase n=1 Tax=Castilleja foliolosa TaxID=1961234 RepID=A0ABD3DIQ4_9LAMI